MLTERTGATKPVAVIIVGADALLAARPATPIQLWHGCLASGYDLAVPATWGDELIAAECLRTLGAHVEPVAIMCTCPMVARTIAGMPFDLSANLVATVAPPVAAAKYLRRVYGDRRVHITYAGACPAAADSAIDAWITPAELLDRFRDTAIMLEEQPELFESTLPPDRRRHLSQPGGLPVATQVATMARPRRVEQLDDADLVAAIERHLATGVRALLDLAPRVGCACSGAAENVGAAEVVGAAESRAAVTRLEPPRSTRPVMADPGGLGLSRRLPVRHPTPAGEPAVRARTPIVSPPTARPDRGPSAAVATRAPTLSPLSWHLRERAHPQPPTTARAEQRHAPESVRATGASSALWASGSSAVHGAPPQPDAVTAAAVRALEQAAAMRTSEARGERQDAATKPAREPQALVERQPEQEREREPVDAEVVSAVDQGVAPDEAPSDAAAPPVEPRPARQTPPGGYWFAAPVVVPASDTEVRRASTPVDAVPDDVGVREAAAEPTADAHPLEQEAAAGEDDDAAPPVVGKSLPGPDAAPRDADARAATVEASPIAGPPSVPDADVAPEASTDTDVAGDEDDVRAELAQLFGLNEESAVGATPTPDAVASASRAADPDPDATTLPARESEPAETTPVPDPSESDESMRRIVVSGPLPWKWLVLAMLFAFVAVMISRRINSRLTSEDVGASALTGGSALPGGLVAPEGIPGQRGDSAPLSPPERAEWSVPRAVPANPSRARRPAMQVAGSRAADSVPTAASRGADSSGQVSSARDSSVGDTTVVSPPAARRDSLAPPPLSAREIELQSIREELARRTARLDSMGRAIGSLYVAPRRPPPGGLTGLPVPPPTALRDPR